MITFCKNKFSRSPQSVAHACVILSSSKLCYWKPLVRTYLHRTCNTSICIAACSSPVGLPAPCHIIYTTFIRIIIVACSKTIWVKRCYCITLLSIVWITVWRKLVCWSSCAIMKRMIFSLISWLNPNCIRFKSNSCNWLRWIISWVSYYIKSCCFRRGTNCY